MKSLPMLIALVFAGSFSALAQSRPSVKQNEFNVSGEPAALSVEYDRHLGAGWRIGAVLRGGPSYGVVVFSEVNQQVRTVASAYPVLAYRWSSKLGAYVSPIGVAAVIGNDWGQGYPSAEAGADWSSGRLRLSSSVRLIRIAGGHGSGSYVLEWIPIRAGLALGW